MLLTDENMMKWTPNLFLVKCSNYSMKKTHENVFILKYNLQENSLFMIMWFIF
jgi:hypothetical protein